MKEEEKLYETIIHYLPSKTDNKKKKKQITVYLFLNMGRSFNKGPWCKMKRTFCGISQLLRKKISFCVVDSSASVRSHKYPEPATYLGFWRSKMEIDPTKQ